MVPEAAISPKARSFTDGRPELRDAGSSSLAPSYRRPLLVLAIGSLPFLLLEFARDELPRSDRVMLDVVNVVVLVGFALDYVVELALASNRRAFVS